MLEKKDEDKKNVIIRPMRSKKDHSHDKRKGDMLERKRRNSHRRDLDALEEEDLEEELHDYR